MWDNVFTMDMLTDDSMVAVNCPSEELEREFAALLDERNIRYPGGEVPSEMTEVWSSYGENFCYYINGRSVRRGPKSAAESSPWNRYEKHTFQGEPQDDTEINDDDFNRIIMS